MQIKTTMSHHFTPVTIAIHQSGKGNKQWRGCGENGALAHIDKNAK